MGDMGDDFRAWKEHRRKKRDSYKSEKMPDDIRRVRNLASYIEERNFGEHLIVGCENARIVDYWPGTRRWIARRSKAKGYDVESLISYLEKNK